MGNVAKSISVATYTTGSTSTASIKCALYDSSNNFVAQTEEKTQSFALNTWFTFNFANDPQLVDGEYRIAAWVNTDRPRLRWDSGVIGYSRRTLNTPYGSWPNPIVWGLDWPDQAFSIYATYEEAPSTVPVTGVTVTPTSATLQPTQTQQLTATVAPANANNPSVTWSTTNASVATVSSSGLVTAVAAGTATITVTTVDGSFTDTCAVTVQEPSSTTYYQSTGGGQIAPVGGVGKRTAKQTGGASIAPQSSIATLISLTQPVGGGHVTLSGALARLGVFAQTVGEAVLTPAGGLRKLIGKNVGEGAVSPTGAAIKRTAKAVGGAVVQPTANLLRGIVKMIAVGGGTVTPTGTLGALKQVGVAIAQRINRLFKSLRN